jgi:hypothetical protein
MDRTSDMYKFIQTLVNFRINQNLWSKPQVQRYVDEKLYAFSRENILALFTNSDKLQQITISQLPFPNGTKLCNIFNSSEDCVVVENGRIFVSVVGDVKIYIIT